MSAIPPTFKWDTGLAKIALLGILVQPPLHALVAEVILTLVAGVPVRACVWQVCTQRRTALKVSNEIGLDTGVGNDNTHRSSV